MSTDCMLHETIWFDRRLYDEAEELNQMHLNGLPLPASHDDHSKTQHHEQHGKSHHNDNKHHGKGQQHGKQDKAPHGGSHGVNEKRIHQLETENKDLRQKTTELEEALKKLVLRVNQLESNQTTASPAKAEVKEEKKEEKKEESDDDDDDLFGSDSEEEDEEQERIKQERLKAYYEKKAKKPQVIAKSNIVLDVKPWDDETNINDLEKNVRTIILDGLVWGASKILPIAYGIKKLQISCVVEDDKVGTDLLEEKITEFEDFVQSVDVVSFNKL